MKREKTQKEEMMKTKEMKEGGGGQRVRSK